MQSLAATPCQRPSCSCSAPYVGKHRSGRLRAGSRVAVAGAMSEQRHGGPEPDEQHFDPYYTKFWTLSDTIKANIREWRDLSATGVELPPATAWSCFVCALLWVKYTLVPEPLRYVWWCIWTAACRFWHPFHKQLVLQGAKLDVYLSARAHPGEHVTVDRARALRRFHWRTNAAGEAWYRLQLIAGALVATLRGGGRSAATAA